MVLDLPTTLHLPLPPQEAELPALAEKLHQRLVKQMALNVRRLDVVYAVMAAAAMASEWGRGGGECEREEAGRGVCHHDSGSNGQ